MYLGPDEIRQGMDEIKQQTTVTVFTFTHKHTPSSLNDIRVFKSKVTQWAIHVVLMAKVKRILSWYTPGRQRKKERKTYEWKMGCKLRSGLR
jgi:hypothetical protein